MGVYFGSLLGGYMLVLGDTVQNLFYEDSLCLFPATLIAVACLLFPTQLRTLHNLSFLSAVSAVTITLAVGVCLASVVLESPPLTSDNATKLIETDSTFMEAFTAITGIVFAYSGQSIYLEMMAEMRQPKEFPKVFFRPSREYIYNIYIYIYHRHYYIHTHSRPYPHPHVSFLFL